MMCKAFSIVVLCLFCASIAKGALDESQFSTELRDLIVALHKQCLQESGTNNDMVTKTHDGEFPNDSSLKNYMKCILAEGGAMDESGNLDFTAVEEIIPDNIKQTIKNMFDTCTPRATNADLAERAYEFYTCCYKNDPKNYFLA